MHSPVRVSRRSALAVPLVATAVLAGCDIDPPEPSDADPTSTPRAPEDRELVLATVSVLAEAETLARATGHAFPELQTLLVALTWAHTSHRTLLVAALPDDEVAEPVAPDLPPRARPALARVRNVERRVLREVEAACLSAASGDLARALASIAGSTAQHLSLIDAELSR